MINYVLDHIYKTIVVPKEIGEEATISVTPPFKYVPVELIHHIQSLLPEKEAARTCVLSKSWLHAWSTIPTLRFTTCVPVDHLTKRKELRYIKLIDRTLVWYLTKRKELQYIKLIDRTLLRYLNENLSLNSIQLHLDIDKLSLPSTVENWFRVLASGNCLKVLSLTICGKKLNKDEVGCLMIPDAIFSCENLNTLSLRVDEIIEPYKVRMNINHVIKCSFLRVLELENVCIRETELLHNLFSSCSLLEKITLDFCRLMEIIKVANLCFLRELRITSSEHIDILDIDSVPSLQVLVFVTCVMPFTMRMDTLGSVRELRIYRVDVDKTFSDMILSKFPFLETLILRMPSCALETFEITSVSLKKLTLDYWFSNKQMNIHIYASNLHSFTFEGRKMPSLLFPSSAPTQIKLILRLRESYPIDPSFFLKVREALDISSNFDITIENNFVPSNIADLDDLRRMFPFPARNVQLLSFGEHFDTQLWKHSPLLDFIFSICHPLYVKAYYRSSNGKNYWHEQMIRMMEQKTCDLNDIEIKNPGDGKWETLKTSWRNDLFPCKLSRESFYDEGNDCNSDEFKLNWWP